MRLGCLVVIGLLLGAVIGAVAGTAVGIASVEIFKVSSFEGYSGMLIFLVFMPVGAIVGGIGGAILLGRTARKKPPADPPASAGGA